MTELGAALLAAVAVWAFAFGARGRWSYKTPAEASAGDLRAVPKWLQPVVTHHNWFKYGGGFAAWVSLVLIFLTKGGSDVLTVLLFALCLLSGGIYGLALSWRLAAITNKTRLRRMKGR